MKWARICLLYTVMALLTLVFLLSLGYAVATSLIPFEHINKIPPLYVISLDNCKKLFEDYPVLQRYVNTVLVTVLTLAGNITTSLLVGYTLVKLEFRGRKFVFNSALVTLMILFQLPLTPPYIMVASLERHNTIKGLVIPFMVSSLSIFTAHQFYLSIPDELIGAVRVDGLGYIGSYFCAVLPLLGPLISTLAILSFTSRWNVYLVPSTSLAKTEKFTLAVGLDTIKAANLTRSNETMVGVALLSLSALIVLSFLQKGFIEGIANSEIRG